MLHFNNETSYHGYAGSIQNTLNKVPHKLKKHPKYFVWLFYL